MIHKTVVNKTTAYFFKYKGQIKTYVVTFLLSIISLKSTVEIKAHIQSLAKYYKIVNSSVCVPKS